MTGFGEKKAPWLEPPSAARAHPANSTPHRRPCRTVAPPSTLPPRIRRKKSPRKRSGDPPDPPRMQSWANGSALHPAADNIECRGPGGPRAFFSQNPEPWLREPASGSHGLRRRTGSSAGRHSRPHESRGPGGGGCSFSQNPEPSIRAPASGSNGRRPRTGSSAGRRSSGPRLFLLPHRPRRWLRSCKISGQALVGSALILGSLFLQTPAAHAVLQTQW